MLYRICVFLKERHNGKKSSYDELAGRIKVLEKELAGSRRNERLLKKDIADITKKCSKLRENEEKFKTIFEFANDEIIYLDKNGKIIEINDRCEGLFGLKRSEVIGKNFFDFAYFDSSLMAKTVENFKQIVEGNSPKVTELLEFQITRKDGKTVFIEVNPRTIEKDGKFKGILSIIRDISDRKKLENELRKYHEELEEMVKERTISLEEANTALRVMLKREDEIRIELEEKILNNVKELILPNVEKLNTSRMDARQKEYLELIESNLDDIISPFSHKLTSRYFNFTSTELKMANLIKHGKTTKEIADMLNLSINTVQFHRSNIRKKIGIKKKKSNLSSYLKSINE